MRRKNSPSKVAGTAKSNLTEKHKLLNSIVLQQSRTRASPTHSTLAMDGTKRKANRMPIAPTVTDFVTTPPWPALPFYHEESAMRSTQSTGTTSKVQPGLQTARDRTAAVSRSASHLQPLRPAPPTPQKRAVKHAPAVQPPAAIHDSDADEIEEAGFLGVDTDDGHDSVYLFNAGADSKAHYHLPSEEHSSAADTLPYQAQLALKHIKRAHCLAEEGGLLGVTSRAGSQTSPLQSGSKSVGSEHACETPRVVPSSPAREISHAAIEQEKARYHNDLLLRNLMQSVKTKLVGGATLIVERTGFVDGELVCTHPQCTAAEYDKSAGAYYVLLGQPRQLERAERWCLSCLERLWKGEGMMGVLPMADAESNLLSSNDFDVTKAPIIALDGAMTETSGIGLDGTMTDARRRESDGPAMQSVSSRTPVSQRSTSMSHSSSGTSTTDYNELELRTSQDHDGLGEDHISPESGSPTPRKGKAKSVAGMSREAQDLMHGFGEAFLDGQVRVARKRSEDGAQASEGSSRRSTRLLPSVSKQTQSLVPKRKSIPSVITTIAGPAKTRTTSTSVLAEDVLKSEARLDEMYKQRAAALESLEPGQKQVLKHPRAPKSSAKHYIRVDEFGVPYTDLLAEPASTYYAKDRVRELPSLALSQQDGTTLSGPRHDALIESKAREQYAQNRESHICTCYGSAEGRHIVRCSNEMCLVGLYHADCVDNAYDVEQWRCKLCTSVCSNKRRTALPPMLSREDIDELFPPNGVTRVRRIITPMSPDKHIASEPDQDDGEAEVGIEEYEYGEEEEGEEEDDFDEELIQLDGPSDESRSRKPLSKSSTALAWVPDSLLISKHAPSAEELAHYPLYYQYPEAPLSPVNRAATMTPGDPVSSEVNVDANSTKPQLSRFQHLAQYMRAGNSLDDEEKAVVELWKTTAQQLGTSAGKDAVGDENRGTRFEKESEHEAAHDEVQTGGCRKDSVFVNDQVEMTNADEASLERKAGINKSECMGSDLSKVLGLLGRA